MNPRSLVANLGLPALITCSFVPAQAKTAQDPQTAERKITGPVFMTHPVGASPLTECVVSLDGSTTAILTEDDRLRLHRLADHLSVTPGEKVESDREFRYGLRQIAIAAKGQFVLAQISGSALAVVDGRPRIQHQLRGMPGVNATAIHPDGVHVLAGTSHGILRLWNAQTGKSVSYLPMEGKPIDHLAITPDGKAIITVDKRRHLNFYGFPQGAKLRGTQLDHDIGEIAFRRDGAVFGYGHEKTVYVRNSATLKPLHRIEVGQAVARLAFSPKPGLLAVGFNGGQVALVRTSDGKIAHAWPAHPGHELVCLQFLQLKAQVLLVTAARGSDVVYWDTAKLLKSTSRKGRRRRRRK